MNILNEVLPSTSVDYVVEQGTSGIWTYRKWNSGIAECWGKDTKSTVVNTAWGSGYYSSSLTSIFPSDLFVEAPTSVSIYISGGYSGLIMNSGTAISKDSVIYCIFRASNLTSAQTFYPHIHAIGKWK